MSNCRDGGSGFGRKQTILSRDCSKLPGASAVKSVTFIAHYTQVQRARRHLYFLHKKYNALQAGNEDKNLCSTEAWNDGGLYLHIDFVHADLTIFIVSGAGALTLGCYCDLREHL